MVEHYPSPANNGSEAVKWYKKFSGNFIAGWMAVGFIAFLIGFLINYYLTH
jgi:hypothetical protein